MAEIAIEKGQIWQKLGTSKEYLARIVRADLKNPEYPDYAKTKWSLVQLPSGERRIFAKDDVRRYYKLVVPAEPKEIPDELLPKQQWMSKENGLLLTIAYAEWNKERGDFDIMGNVEYADPTSILSKALREQYNFVLPRAHDFSNPYLFIVGALRCVACGTVRNDAQPLQYQICIPNPGWRERHEKRLAEEQQWRAQLAAEEPKRVKRVAPQPGFLQSHNLGAGIGIFSLRDESAAIKVGAELRRIMKVKMVDSTKEPF